MKKFMGLLFALFACACATVQPKPALEVEQSKPSKSAKPEVAPEDVPPAPRSPPYGEWIEVTTAQQFARAINKYQRVVIILSAPWCAPCKKVSAWWATRRVPPGWTFVHYDDVKAKYMFDFTPQFEKVLGDYNRELGLPTCAIVKRMKRKGRVAYLYEPGEWWDTLPGCTIGLDKRLEIY